MNQYRFRFGRNSQLVWALVLPAFICLKPMLLAIEYLLPRFPDSDWLSIVMSVSYLGLVMLISFKWVASINARVIITVDEQTIAFEFPVKNIFHRHNFTLGFNEISELKDDTDKGMDFLYIKSKHLHFKRFYVSAEANRPDFLAFKIQLLKMIEQSRLNAGTPSTVSKSTVYQSGTMKFLVLLLLFFTILFPLVMVFKPFSINMVLKYITMVVMCTPLFIKVFHHNKRWSDS